MSDTEMGITIPKNRLLSETKSGKKVISIRRRYVSNLNQVCSLDSNYEYDYALYLDHLYEVGRIAGWVRNTTKFGFSEPVEIPAKGGVKKQYSHRPDFIIFNKDGSYEIHECKGWFNQKAEIVDKAFRRDYPQLKYKVIGKDEILSLQNEYGNKLWGWVKIR